MSCFGVFKLVFNFVNKVEGVKVGFWGSEGFVGFIIKGFI